MHNMCFALQKRKNKSNFEYNKDLEYIYKLIIWLLKEINKEHVIVEIQR